VGVVGEPGLRADALRNRRRILDAAAEAFAERGLEAGVAEIARRAGVGAGTIFRRFPTKEDLIAAIVEQRIDEMTALGEQALAADDPGAAFREFMLAGIEHQIRDRGFFDAAKRQMGAEPRLRDARDRLIDVSGQLLKRAQDAGAARGDLTPQDVPILMCAGAGTPPPLLEVYPDVWRRYAAIVLDGMKPADASDLGHDAPDVATLDALASAATAVRPA
jgi:AcrR family transcriptional regulator